MERATEYFKNGYSCSESVVKAAIDKGLVHESALPLATAFSGGIGSGCLCGAVAGMQIIIGAMYGRDDKAVTGKKQENWLKNPLECLKKGTKQLAAEF